ncbi:pirin family protein [Brevundimonas sp. GCM10030266]|uniref:pirin family protein n=1 Tax=Brevundimonas sp. GCM10030266 TaxID=3273386 RepID=UPI00360E2280
MIEAIIDQRRRSLGGILEVGRVLPAAKQLMVGPFIFFDHIGPINIPVGIDRSADTRAHPHIGLSTVTYLFSGEMMHRDSLGYALPVRPQEVNWMTAGSGITHSERLEKGRAVGDRLHGIQAWVALPNEFEETAPAFTHYESEDMPFWDEVGVRGHLIAGSAYGLTSKTQTHSPLFYAHLEVQAGATAEIPGGHGERAIYVATGAVELGGQRLGVGQMAVLNAQASSLKAIEPSTVMVLGGEPVGERYLLWNFVSSSPERLRAAAEDWKAGRMKLPDADDQEFTPFPETARITPPVAA